MRRRELLHGLALGGLLPGIEGLLGPLNCPGASRPGTSPPAPGVSSPFGDFEPIAPSDADEVLLPPGFRYDVVLKWGDPFTAEGRSFGFNNDYIGTFVLDGEEEALLVVNHEYISGIVPAEDEAPVYDQAFRILRGRRPTRDDFKRDVGVSVVRVRRDGASGAWRPVLRDRLNRRIDAFSPCAADGPAAGLLGGQVQGTFDNCAGQVTPWSTALSCEENFDQRVPAEVDAQGRYRRGGVFDLPGGHYGWVVEVDPYDPGAAPVKHTALGRFRHENVGLRAQPGQPVAAYMGDDRKGGHVWKFVSEEPYRPSDRAGSRRLLAAGRLYAARFHADGTGEWRRLEPEAPLDPNPAERDLKPAIPRGARRLGDCYGSLGAMLMDAYRAANALGATPCGRPEDLEVDPADGSVVVAFTLELGPGTLHTNTYGEIWRIEEEGGDVKASRFRWSRFLAGGPADTSRAGRVIAHPDNILFDSRRGLWLTSDIPGDRLNATPEYRVFKNSGLFFVPSAGPQRAVPLQFASMPCEVEPTGPSFAPGEQALFLSVQHPGERSGIRRRAEAAPRGSNWPHQRLGAPPQPAIIAIRRSG